MAAALCEWQPVPKSLGQKPIARHGHRAVAIDNLIIIFGGGNAGILNDLHVYDSSINAWMNPVVSGDIPPGCASFGFATIEKQIILFGGMLEYGMLSNYLYQLSPYDWSWKKIDFSENDIQPSYRIGHTFTSIANKIYMFGGLQNDRCNSPTDAKWMYLNDLHTLEFDNQQYKWSILDAAGIPPQPRESHTAVAYTCPETSAPTLIIYGGMNSASVRLGDTWILDIQTMTWIRPNVNGIMPLPRSLHSATIVNNLMFVFGGWIPVPPYSKWMWLCTNTEACLNLETMTWQEVISAKRPGPRTGHCSVALHGRIYIWSGRDGYKKKNGKQICLNDMWYLEVDVPPPPSRPEIYKLSTNSMDLKWSQTHSAHCYMLECQIEPSTKPVPIGPQNRLKLGTIVKLSQPSGAPKVEAGNVSEITHCQTLKSMQSLPATILNRSENVTLTQMSAKTINPAKQIADSLAQGKEANESGGQLTLLKPTKLNAKSQHVNMSSLFKNIGMNRPMVLNPGAKFTIVSNHGAAQSELQPTIRKNVTVLSNPNVSGLPANTPNMNNNEQPMTNTSTIIRPIPVVAGAIPSVSSSIVDSSF